MLNTESASPGTSMPDLCVQEGIDCTSCTRSTARELARACPGLPVRMVAQLFVQIHVHAACVRMHRNFTDAYAEALESARPLAKSAAAEIGCPLGAAAAA
jgi:hypothetical protein